MDPALAPAAPEPQPLRPRRRTAAWAAGLLLGVPLADLDLRGGR
ncbi:hypothetical protein [Streptomyces sp. NPDC002825]